MIGTIDLYKLALTPNDTMYFDSVNAQTEWFNNQEHLSIDNISFNGDRAFRLGQNYLDVVFNYNYVRYKLNDRYIYAFIENVTYNNDNTSSLNISIDLNQTFLHELQTAISTSNIGNVTKKDSYFTNTLLPFDNKISVPYYNSINLGSLNKLKVNYNLEEYIVGYIAMNISKDVNHNNSSTKLTDNGFFSNIYCYVLPILYSLTNNKLSYASFKVRQLTGVGVSILNLVSAADFNTFILNYGSYIENGCVSICFDPLADFDKAEYDYESNSVILYDNYNPLQPAVEHPSQKQKYIIASQQTSGNTTYPFTQDNYIINIYNNETTYYFSFDLTSYLSIPYPILRQPYVYIRVGNDTENIILNLCEFENISNNNVLSIHSFTSCMYPFTTNIKFLYNGGEYIDRNALFNLVTTTPIPYTLSAWQEYYARNSASVNDGLATQQKYERKQQTISTVGNLLNTAIDIGTSFIPYTKAGNFYKRGAGHVSDRTQVSGIVGGAQTIINTATEWANSELQREKERALLDISWNDIKSSPSLYSNSMSGLTTLYRAGIQNIEIDLYIATNINDIIRYHKQYGYKVNRMEKLTWQDIKQHTVFDYISFNTITLKSTLPQFYTAMIEQQYEQGVRFWYDYDNFMNYEIENEEVQ